MFINVKARLDEPAIKELLAYSVFSDPDILDKTIHEYISDNRLELLGYEQEGEIIGFVGFILDESRNLEIKHIAVQPEYRGFGYGRGQILELIEAKKPIEIIAVADEEAVDFFRNIGFEIIGLGEIIPGSERFKCIYETEGND